MAEDTIRMCCYSFSTVKTITAGETCGIYILIITCRWLDYVPYIELQLSSNSMSLRPFTYMHVRGYTNAKAISGACAH